MLVVDEIGAHSMANVERNSLHQANERLRSRFPWREKDFFRVR